MLFPVVSFQCPDKLVGLLLCRLFGDAVTLLNSSDELLAPSVDDIQIIIGKLSPFFFCLAFVLLPFAFDLIPVHGLPPWLFSGSRRNPASNRPCRTFASPSG